MSAFREILKEQLDPIRQDINAIKTHGVSRADLDAKGAPISSAIDDITTRLEILESRDASRAPTPGPSARTGSEASIGTSTFGKLQALE
eukprot:9490272-Pyramimonas_sp.AAC.1